MAKASEEKNSEGLVNAEVSTEVETQKKKTWSCSPFNAQPTESPNLSSGGISGVSSISPTMSSDGQLDQSNDKKLLANTKRENWREDEHARFKKALEHYGRNWKMVEKEVGTRSAKQIRSHAQKYFLRLVREHSEEQHNIPPARKWKSRKTKSNAQSEDNVCRSGENKSMMDSPDFSFVSPDLHRQERGGAYSPEPCAYNGMSYVSSSPPHMPSSSPHMPVYYSSPHMQTVNYHGCEGRSCGTDYMCGASSPPMNHSHESAMKHQCGGNYFYQPQPYFYCDCGQHAMGMPVTAPPPPPMPHGSNVRYLFELHRRQHGLPPVPPVPPVPPFQVRDHGGMSQAHAHAHPLNTQEMMHQLYQGGHHAPIGEVAPGAGMSGQGLRPGEHSLVTQQNSACGPNGEHFSALLTAVNQMEEKGDSRRPQWPRKN
eukprot:Plantae.Rhodophyta-Purpureofilum_apyrenoidigerum.ctg10969.p1 GENE.Plantae.Rhodophyta-Purpureofilum_apyrenoidigerum.ctg10969~~Plantae.Rhodophyta-Purpureofilum_apyrenoidigerum.ctg10969.p1  ORF type:complete len:499 (+),score=47.64 Plantae.Rhodophyta-Purpureofilum_apyrenoidigerum.ctg10969:218-1498(+)